MAQGYGYGAEAVKSGPYCPRWWRLFTSEPSQAARFFRDGNFQLL